MRLICLFISLLFCCIGACSFQITEVYPDTYLVGDADEYVTISGIGSLHQIELSDGEGMIRFPVGAVSKGSVTIARGAESYRKVVGVYPEYELINECPEVPEPILTKKFQLANKKDELYLSENGIIVQNISWPGTFKPRKGQVHFIGDDGHWNPRVLMSGGTRIKPETFHSVSGTVFVSPDCSRSVFEDAINGASRELLVNIYEFTDNGFVHLLCDASDRGVDVIVLLEGGPVGGISPEEQGIIARLISKGITVNAMIGTGEDHPPYRYNHAKYLVIDKERLLITTENFKDHSFPPPGLSGNRGFGVIMDSPELAEYFSTIFFLDMNSRGVLPIKGYNYEISQYSAASYSPVFEPVSFTATSVTPVIAPDTSSLIVPFIMGADHRLLITQAYIKHWSAGKKNPYIQAAINAAERGVEVKILLDSYYYNTEGDYDNDEMVAELNALADQRQLPLKARLIDLSSSGLLKLHAKGVVADDSVFISSINWNENSPVFNREAGLIIDNSKAADYFARVFYLDWEGGRISGFNQEKDIDWTKVGFAAGIVLFLVLLYFVRHYRR